jgi:hypothetical protein
MPAGFPEEAFRSVGEIVARPDDIFISTYPKCGTTWMQNIVWLILHGAVPLGSEERMTDLIPHMEEIGAEGVEALPHPRVLKTHLPFSMTPYHPEARYVYVLRNPFDCVVSFFHHTRGFVQHYDFYEGNFDDYFRCFVQGEVDFGDYFENVLSWWVHRTKRNFLFVTYEDLKADPRSGIARVGRFLGSKYGAAVDDPLLLDRIVELSSFQSMSRDQSRWASDRPEDRTPFVRKGEVGDFLNVLSPSQVEQILERFRSTDGAEGLAALWPDVMEQARKHRQE